MSESPDRGSQKDIGFFYFAMDGKWVWTMKDNNNNGER